jgi:hypothetical protein
MSKPVSSGYLYTGNGTTGMPDPTVMGTIGQFGVVGLAGTAVNNAFSVQWSAQGDLEDWPIPGTTDARTKQAGIQIMSAEYGKVTGIAGNDFFGYIFQQRAITKMTYIGGDVAFHFDTFEYGRGCIDYNRFVQAEGAIYYQSEHGYHALKADQIVDIGFKKVDRLFKPALTNRQGDVVANTANKVIWFDESTITDQANRNGLLGSTGRALTYNYYTDQWTNTDDLISSDGQNSIVFGLYDINDEDAYIGMLMRDTYTVDITDGTNGAAQASQFQTTDYNLNPGGRAIVDGVRLNSNMANPTVGLRLKDYVTDTPENTDGSTFNTRTQMSHFREGNNNRADARFHALNITTAAGTAYTSLSSAEFDFTPAGKI